MKKWKEIRSITRKKKRYDDGSICTYESNGESRTLCITKKNDWHIYLDISGENIPSEAFTLAFADELRSMVISENKPQQTAPELQGLFDGHKPKRT